MSFLPKDYEAPQGNSSYMKFEQGENRFRFMSAPILGWIDWKDKKPLRFPMDKKPKQPVDLSKPIKHFWAAIVYDQNKKDIKILEITQSGIQKAIEDITRSDDWGAPYEYDIKITRKGEGKETEYSVFPCPKKPLSEEALKAFDAKPICLEALYKGEDPFNSTPATKLAVEQDDDLPF